MTIAAARASLLAVLVGVAPCTPAAAADSLPSTLPLRRDVEAVSETSLWLPSILLLGLGGAAAGFLLWRRGGAGSPRLPGGRRVEGAVTRMSSHALTPHASVHAVQWHGQEFLVGCTAQQVTLLARRDAPAAQEDAK